MYSDDVSAYRAYETTKNGPYTRARKTLPSFTLVVLTQLTAYNPMIYRLNALRGIAYKRLHGVFTPKQNAYRI